MRILVVEDDSLLGDAIQSGLRELGNAVDWIRDGVAGDAALSAQSYSAVVLDLGLPRLSGLELLHRMRNRNDRTPVLILTARDGVEDRIKGLDAGADDYLVKPFDMGELGARLRAISRRAAGQAEPVVRLAGIELDPPRIALCFAGNRWSCPREFALLEALMRNAGRVSYPQRNSSRRSILGEKRSKATRSRCTSIICVASLPPSRSRPCEGWVI